MDAEHLTFPDASFDYVLCNFAIFLFPHLEQAGFSDVQVRKEQVDFDYKNAQEWWDACWTHGPRYALEHMTPEVLAQFKTEVLAYLQQEEEQGNSIRETLLLQYFITAKNYGANS